MPNVARVAFGLSALAAVVLFVLGRRASRRSFEAAWLDVGRRYARPSSGVTENPAVTPNANVAIHLAGPALFGRATVAVHDDGIAISNVRHARDVQAGAWFPYAMFSDVREGAVRVAINNRRSADWDCTKLSVPDGGYIALDRQTGADAWGRWRVWKARR